MRKHIFKLKYYFILVLISASICKSQAVKVSPIPENSRQVILVLTDSIKSTKGNLYRYERKDDEKIWKQTGKEIPVVIGRNGLAWGRGINPIDSSMLPIKTEGDGRSPAGVFKLTSAFGYADAQEMKGLKIPYLEITDMIECVDDDKSAHYNQIVNRVEVDSVDWQSSEKMFFADIWYKLGVIVDQNSNPTVKGNGSCIFLHNWSVPDETTAGCTEMEPANLKEIIYWLDSSANPVLVQLTKQLYKEYMQSWELPISENSIQ